MRLLTLKTENFRNLYENPPQFSDGINVLYGNNAAGKTNTLEAVYLFATGKSFRTRNESDFINHNENYTRLEIEYHKSSLARTMSIAYARNGTKALKGMQVEGMSVDRVSEFLGNFRAVLFTPDHLGLVKGAPEERRHLVDVALCQIKPRYVKSLNDYSKVLMQRNNYLKSIKLSNKKADFDYLDVLNLQLSNAGAVIIKQRGLYCEKLSELSRQMYSRLTEHSEQLYIRYLSRVNTNAFTDEKEISDALYKMYSSDNVKDTEQGRTRHGPHYDELMIYVAKKEEKDLIYARQKQDFDNDLGDYSARTFGSQGQQRSAVLSIKLAEGEIVKEKCGEYPVYLLDDLYSELDANRRERLSGMFRNRQCIITCCDDTALPKNTDFNIIKVENGKYSR